MICLFLVLSSILIFISPSFNMFMALLAVYNMSTDNWDPECRNISTRRLCAENWLKKSYDSLEARYDTLSDEIGSIKTILSEISTKVTLLVEGKINTNGEK